MLQALNNRFALDDQLTFVEHSSGLCQAVVSTPLCRGLFYLHGAHVAEFQPIGQPPVLFMSGHSEFKFDKPIRGGVPLCFPWFGPHPSDRSAPAHGVVRTRSWEMQSSSRDASGNIDVVLALEHDQWRLTYTVQFGQSLELALQVENLADSMRDCELALHTYLTLADVQTASVHGLERQSHWDKLTGELVEPSGQPIQFTQETDRVYHGSVDEIIVRDPGFHRRIRLEPRGSRSTVVWNPWIEKSRRMADFGDDEFQRMCCVETANVGENRLQLAGLASSLTGVRISVLGD